MIHGLHTYFKLILFLFLSLNFKLLICQSQDNYETYNMEGEEGHYLLDINNYHNLKLIISTSQNIYMGIPPRKIAKTNAKLSNCSSLMTLNENYLLASCLEDCLLAQININTGESFPLAYYSNISNLSLLSPPEETTCSISMFKNMVFIGYTKINDNNKTNIILKVNIYDEDSINGPSINETVPIKYFKFPNSYFKTSSIRQVGCEGAYISNNLPNYRLICVYETYDINNKVQLYAFSVKNNMKEIDTNDKELRIYGFSFDSGFRLYRMNSTTIRCVMRDMIKDLYLSKVNGNIRVLFSNINTNLSSITSIKDIFDYNNDCVFSCEFNKKNNLIIGNIFMIRRGSSSNYYNIYEYNQERIIKLQGYYDEIFDNLILIYQSSSYIKYLIIKNNRNICEIDNYSGILKIETNEITVYSIEKFLSYYSDFDKINFKEIIIYESSHKPNNLTSLTLILREIDLVKIFYLFKVDIYIKGITEDIINCTEDFYKYDNYNYSNYNDKISHTFNNHQKIEGYLYNPNLKVLEYCNNSLEIDVLNDNQSSFPKEIYQYFGNCYSINETEISLDSNSGFFSQINNSSDKCPLIQINLMNHLNDSLLNFFEFTSNSLIMQIYKNITILKQQYKFNKECYEICPLFSKPDFIGGACKCQSSFHMENETIICHENDSCIYNNYNYYLDDTKECISGISCPAEYYQINYLCYKNGCPPETKEYPENSKKCINISNYYINETYQIISNTNPDEMYLFIYNDTSIYLKSCEETINFTKNDQKSYLYNKTCYLTCPENTIKDEINHECIEKEIYLNESKTIISQPTKEIYLSNLISFNSNIISKTSENIIESVGIINGYKCPSDFPYLDNINNGCKKSCLFEELYSKNCSIIKDKNIIYRELKENIIQSYPIYIGKNLVFEAEEVYVFQLTTSLNEIKTLEGTYPNNYNLSMIDLGECEKILKEKNDMSENDTLIILKYEKLTNISSEKYIEYEVYNPMSRKQMDLSICKDMKINISIPVTVDQKNSFKYNSSSEYYNDICCPYPSEDKKDIILQDRRDEYINNNLSLCEENCEYAGLDEKNVKCECDIKLEFHLIIDIEISKNKLIKNFGNLKYFSNFYVLKCYKIIFDNIGIGCILLLIIIFLNIILLIIFMINGYKNFKNKISILGKCKGNIIKNKKNKKIVNKRKGRSKNFKIKGKKKKRINSDPSEKKFNFTKDKKSINILNTGVDMNSSKSFSKVHFKNSFNLINLKNNKNVNIFLLNNNPNQFNKLDYNDYEINTLPYENALKVDKRTYFEYYISLIKRKQIIIFTFCVNNDYNSKILKISIFLFSFALYFTINAFFFNDSTMHKIFQSQSSFDFNLQIPLIIYSSLISYIITLLINFLSLSEKDVLKIKIEENKNKNKKLQEVIKSLNIKFSFYFIFSFLLLGFFWLYITCFGGVYRNTEIILIKDTLISYGFSLLYPLFLSIFPGFIRIPALKSKNKKCSYSFSKLLQII